ncbi:MAG: tyrosine--tRNA ligase [Candidatus Nealsonbacteria bacterium]|nr:tyrosine--tRNA ligase [Candidatus Nealsonbacteria bacterium]
MEIKIDSQKIEEVLTRGVERIYPSWEELEKVLRSGRKIRLYNGIDPTGKLHLGHLAVLRKLRQFQNLGHEVIVLIGDFTAMIGDPTDKAAVRKPLTRSQVLENAKNYAKQIGRILDLKKPNVKFLHNAKWSNELKPADLLEIFSSFTVARLLERDMFQKRIQEGKDILLHEFVYPVFQAYDSVAMDVDLEVGGNDQTFNMLRGRDLMRKMKNKEKFVMALKLLTDPSGKKMGKSEGNFVSLEESPQEMYGKIMAWPDSLLESGFEMLTDVPMEEIKKMGPRDAKARLAREIVTACHDVKEAREAEEEFSRIFQKGELPSEVPSVKVPEKTLQLLDLVVRAGLASSKSEAKRLVIQGGLKIDNIVERDWRKTVQIKKGTVLQAGKRNFAKVD